MVETTNAAFSLVESRLRRSLIHTVFNELGHEAARVLLNSVQKLVNYWMNQHSYTVGVGDTNADPETMKQVAKTQVAPLLPMRRRAPLPSRLFAPSRPCLHASSRLRSFAPSRLRAS